MSYNRDTSISLWVHVVLLFLNQQLADRSANKCFGTFTVKVIFLESGLFDQSACLKTVSLWSKDCAAYRQFTTVTQFHFSVKYCHKDNFLAMLQEM